MLLTALSRAKALYAGVAKENAISPAMIIVTTVRSIIAAYLKKPIT